MTSHTLALTIAYAASVFGVAAVIPQILRTLRHPHMAGVAPLSYFVSILACTGFMIYGLRADVIPQIPGNVLLVRAPSRSSCSCRATCRCVAARRCSWPA